jgi:hypothetical protein
LTPDDLQDLARLAGLEIGPDRAPLVLAELNGQRANLHQIDTLLPAPTPAAARTYDPAFPPVRVPRETPR